MSSHSDGLNPYASSENDIAPATVFPPYEPVGEIRRVQVRSISLLKRGYELMGDQYWLFVGITLIGVLIGAAVPFGVLMAPMLVGIHLCFVHREARGQVEFGTLFKGFDKFQEALIAFLLFLCVSMAFMLVFGGLFFVVFIQMVGPNGNVSEAAIVTLVTLYLSLIFISTLLYIPFLFSFQLIADRGLSGMEAVKASWEGAKANFGGLVWLLIVNTFLSMLAALMCYLPVFLFMPISFSALFVLYRDIYGPRADALEDHVV